MAQTSGAPPSGGVTLVQSAILYWPSPPLTPDKGGEMQILPGTLQPRYLQAFLPPSPRSPLVFIPSTYPYALELWYPTSNGSWAMNQTITLTKVAGQPLQILQAEPISLGYTIASVRSVVQVQFPLTESLLIQLPSTPPLTIRSITRGVVDISPSLSITTSMSQTATATSRYLRATESSIASASVSPSASVSASVSASASSFDTVSPQVSPSSTASTTSFIVPVYYTPSIPYTWSSTPTPANAPTWPSPTPTFTPTSRPQRTPTQTPSPTPTNTSWIPPAPANSAQQPPLTPGEITGLSIPLLLLLGASAALGWLFRSRIKNYMLARGWRKSIPRFNYTYPSKHTSRAPRPRPSSNPVFVSNPSFRSSLTQEQKDIIHALRVERTKKAFEPMKSKDALV
jgi:hypothetical protein